MTQYFSRRRRCVWYVSGARWVILTLEYEDSVPPGQCSNMGLDDWSTNLSRTCDAYVLLDCFTTPAIHLVAGALQRRREGSECHCCAAFFLMLMVSHLLLGTECFRCGKELENGDE